MNDSKQIPLGFTVKMNRAGYGVIAVRELDELRSWISFFEREEDIAAAQRVILSHPEHAGCGLILQGRITQVAAGRPLIYFYTLVPRVDAVGIADGCGQVLFCGDDPVRYDAAQARWEQGVQAALEVLRGADIMDRELPRAEWRKFRYPEREGER
jgi:hypothetical protein